MNKNILLKAILLICIVALYLTACSSVQNNLKDEAKRSQNEPANKAISENTSIDAKGFVNKVWEVRESAEVAKGTIYVFLSDGTLVVTSPQSKPALGNWHFNNNTLTIVEDSQTYKVEILKLNNDEWHVRISNPKSPVEIKFAPAQQTFLNQ